MIFCKIGPNMKDVIIQAIQCDETCPEDCTKDKWVYGTNKTGFTKDAQLVLKCSSLPKFTSSVQECIENFDVTLHPNIGLLPEKCGKQSTGKLNSVTHIMNLKQECFLPLNYIK